jgi:hypothetical protein
VVRKTITITRQRSHGESPPSLHPTLQDRSDTFISWAQRSVKPSRCCRSRHAQYRGDITEGPRLKRFCSADALPETWARPG